MLWILREIHSAHLGSTQRNDKLNLETMLCTCSYSFLHLLASNTIRQQPRNQPSILHWWGPLQHLLPMVQDSNNKWVSEFQYIDDDCTLALELEDLQNSVDNFSSVHMCYGLTINLAKIKVLLQPQLGINHHLEPKSSSTDWTQRMLNNLHTLAAY